MGPNTWVLEKYINLEINTISPKANVINMIALIQGHRAW